MMKITVIFLLGFQFFLLGAAEQTLRSQWRLEESSTSFFYRLEEDDVSTELLLRADESFNGIEPARFIFDSPFILAGTIKPLGMFKLFELDSLIGRESLKDRSRYGADRSAESLDNPGGAVFWPEWGGLFFETNRQQYFNGGTWLSLEPGSCSHLDCALDISIREDEETEDPEEAEWFRESPSDVTGSLLHAGSDLRFDYRFLSLRVRTSLSVGDHYFPGVSVLPEIHFIFDRVALYTRYWRNSADYRTRFMEYPDWNWQFEGEALYYTGCGFWSLKGLTGRPRPESPPSPQTCDLPCQEYNLKWQREGDRLDWQLKGTGSLDPEESSPYQLGAEGSLGVRLGSWYLKGGGGGQWEGFPLWPLSRNAEILLRHRVKGLVQNSLKLSCSADEDGTGWEPAWSGTVFLGRWNFSASAAYEMMEWGDPARSPFSMTLKIEWSG